VGHRKRLAIVFDRHVCRVANFLWSRPSRRASRARLQFLRRNTNR
jgi:hypothetical protein